MSQSRKRKPVPELYDHNKRSNPVRNFTRIPGSNSLIVNSARVTTTDTSSTRQSSSSGAHDTFAQDYDQQDATDQDHVPANPDSSESVGIKVKPKPRYQNTVRFPESIPMSCAECFLLQDAPLKTWVAEFRTVSLDERMRYEGRGNKGTACPDCQGQGAVRCEDCFGRELLCRGCCLKRHQQLPLHRIKVSNNTLFARVGFSSAS